MPLVGAIVYMVTQSLIKVVDMTGFEVTLFLFIALSVFYCDLCLGFMFDDILDIPTEKNLKTAYYWLFFVGERLSLFSF